MQLRQPCTASFGLGTDSHLVDFSKMRIGLFNMSCNILCITKCPILAHLYMYWDLFSMSYFQTEALFRSPQYIQ